jgi:hypothetical protein
MEKVFTSNPDLVVMYNRVKIFMFFLILLIILALFVLIALWMMITLNPGSRSGAIYLLFDQIGQVVVAIMEILSGALVWLLDRFWSLIGLYEFLPAPY